MSRKWIICIIVILLLPIFTAIVFGDDTGDYLKPGNGKVTAGDSTGFKIDLENVTEEKYGTFKITIEVAPAEPHVVLDLDENVDITVNKITGRYSIASTDIVNYKALNFTLTTDKSIDEEMKYTVTVAINGEYGSNTDSFDFDVTPHKEKKKKQHGGGGGFSVPSDVDYVDIYQGSDDNYLYQLSVSGYSFTQKFYKTRNVYFVDVKDSVTSLQVSAVPCDRKAKVYVAGNQDVSRDFSKIVVDVKAVNGDVRTYTIYVRH